MSFIGNIFGGSKIQTPASTPASTPSSTLSSEDGTVPEPQHETRSASETNKLVTLTLRYYALKIDAETLDSDDELKKSIRNNLDNI